MTCVVAEHGWRLLAANASDPNWAETWTAYANIAVAIAALLALWQIVHARRARHAEAMTESARRWDERSFRQARATVRRHNDAGGPEGVKSGMLELRADGSDSFYELLSVLDYFEDIAILIKHRALTFRIVDDSLGTTVVEYWKYFEPFVKELRRRRNDQRSFENFEKLADRISKRHWYYVVVPVIPKKAGTEEASSS